MTVRVHAENRDTIFAAFLRFHAAHPEVYTDLVEICRDLRRRGYRQLGIGMVYEVARWRSMVRRDPGEEFRLNNNHRAYYARLIMEQEPDLAGVFATRRLGEPSHVAP